MLTIPSLADGLRQQYTHAIDLCTASEKFMLPDGGLLLDDDELRALDPSEALRLPYKLLALEYTTTASAVVSEFFGTRRILLVREHDDAIRVNPFDFNNANGQWKPRGEFRLPLTGFKEDRPEGIHYVCTTAHNVNGVMYLHEVKTVLAFLNALACSNVRRERSETKHLGKKVKSALPFDTYHVLTIDARGRPQGDGNGFSGPHRAPREHLRRGHIRRLPDSRRIWINATVVAAGKSAGRVSKDYAVRSTTSFQSATA